MHLSGNTINLLSNDYTATIVTMGGAIASLKYMGMDITMPFNPQTIPVAHQGKILAPWPNRITDGKYTFNDKEYQLPITDFKTNSASHGLVAWKEWRISSITQSSLELETYVSPIYGYPFLIALTASYEVIDGMGLKIDITAKNVGKSDAPYGVGMHPYITCDGELIDNCKLTMPFKHVYSLTERLTPDTLVSVDDMDFNFIESKEIGDRCIDHCFLSPDSTRMNTVILENKQLKVYCKTNAPFMQLFTPEKLGRKCLAVEPMSCPANAFNNGIGLITLKEQQYYTLTYIIGALKQVVQLLTYKPFKDLKARATPQGAWPVLFLLS